MIPVNCALFAGNVGLANSILFGHVKGAFTGADRDREGAFVAADAGILFLDEVGELPARVQAKLLRVLEDGQIKPEGADRPRRQVDVRVVAATNRDLPTMMRRGEFRTDLYHRLDTLRIEVPPLRDHPEDIALIAADTLRNLEAAGADGLLSPAELRELRSYDWPGNVRQLIKVLKRSAYLGIPIAETLAEERACALGAREDEGWLLPRSAEEIRPIRKVREEYAARALELNDGNLAATARALGIAPNTLRSYLRRRCDGD
jgi:transcriptional regulator with GAF, ATPase, and Fis domain